MLILLAQKAKEQSVTEVLIVNRPGSFFFFFETCLCILRRYGCSPETDFQRCKNLITKLQKMTGRVQKISVDCMH